MPLISVDHYVEVIISAERDPPRRAALGRICVCVVKLPKSRSIFQIAERRCAAVPRRTYHLHAGYRGRQRLRSQRLDSERQQALAIYLPLQSSRLVPVGESFITSRRIAAGS